MPYVETPQSVCRLGVARCDVTPPVGIYHRMWGAATHDRATGVHRPLTATALAFRPADAGTSPDEEQVLVALDHALLEAGEMDGVLRAVCRANGLAAAQVVMTFSHTHAAGRIGLERAGLPGGDLIQPYLEELGARLAGVVAEARRNVAPVTITYGAVRCALAAHRDFWDAAGGKYVCGFNPDGEVDDTVLVARATDGEGRVVATVVNYACHPTTLAWQNTLLSPDYPGAMRELVEQATAAPCVFLQGASGDVGPREGFVGDPAVADRNGRQLGYATLAALEALPPPGTRFQYTGPVVSGATLGTWAHRPLPVKRIAEQGRWRLRRWAVDLPYRADLPTREQAEAELARWRSEEEAARRRDDAARSRDCRALAERMTRVLTRLKYLPPGPTLPLPVTLWQTGDAFWLALESEHYNLLQSSLRRQFPGVPVVVATLANGSRATYLPAADAYGKGIYQESIAVLAPGCLEQLLDLVAVQIRKWREEPVGQLPLDVFPA